MATARHALRLITFHIAFCAGFVPRDAAVRRKLLKPYQVNADIMAMAKKDAIFMHCLPAHRGDEVTDGVMDGKQSAAFLQAGGRLRVSPGYGLEIPTVYVLSR